MKLVICSNNEVLSSIYAHVYDTYEHSSLYYTESSKIFLESLVDNLHELIPFEFDYRYELLFSYWNSGSKKNRYAGIIDYTKVPKEYEDNITDIFSTCMDKAVEEVKQNYLYSENKLDIKQNLLYNIINKYLDKSTYEYNEKMNFMYAFINHKMQGKRLSLDDFKKSILEYIKEYLDKHFKYCENHVINIVVDNFDLSNSNYLPINVFRKTDKEDFINSLIKDVKKEPDGKFSDNDINLEICLEYLKSSFSLSDEQYSKLVEVLDNNLVK